MISFGMMWCGSCPKYTLFQSISDALTFYAVKYPDKPPNLVAVHPFEFDPDVECPIEVRPWQYVLPKHVIVGISDDSILQPNPDRQALQT